MMMIIIITIIIITKIIVIIVITTILILIIKPTTLVTANDKVNIVADVVVYVDTFDITNGEFKVASMKSV